ncbi:hypothetical protein ACO0SA_000125 [Hanseniaspora valbyensis]
MSHNNHDILNSLEHYDRGLNLDPPSYDTLTDISPLNEQLDSGRNRNASINVDEDEFGDFDIDNDLFLTHDGSENNETSNNTMEQMEFEDTTANNNNNNNNNNNIPRGRGWNHVNRQKTVFYKNKLKNIYHNLKMKTNDYIIIPMKILIIDPFFKFYYYLTFRFDYHLNKIGNPIIMKRFIYVFVMSVFIYFVYSFTNNEETNGTVGKFTDHDEFLHYAKKCIDLKKFEQDLEYISSMSHQPGSMGNQLISNYIHESFSNNGIKNLAFDTCVTYLNYPSKETTMHYYNSDGHKIEIPLNYNNFNPLSINGTLENTHLYYGNMGKEEDYKTLQDKNENIKFDEIALLMKYDDHLVSEQIMMAQEKHVKAIIFISNDDVLFALQDKLKNHANLQTQYDYLFSNFNNSIQNIPVGIPQYGLGDPLTPGTTNIFEEDKFNYEKLDKSKMIPHILTIPVSIDQIRPFYDSLLEMDNSVNIDLKISLETFFNHPTINILAKIEGKEQNNKAIIIASSRDSFNNGANYPNFGTSSLLSLAQMYQQLKFKYKWKPLRNIYFISYDATMYNGEGPTEMLESQLSNIADEIYTFIDITGLNINSNTIKLEATPLLHDAIKRMNDKFDFRIIVDNIKHYGNWSPYMANGMPVIAIGDNDNRLPNFSNLDNWDMMYNRIHMDYNNGDLGYERVTRVLLFILELTLSIVDDPIIPLNFNDLKTDLSFQLQDLMLMYEHYRKQDDTPSEIIDFNKISISLMEWQYVLNDWESILKMWEQIVVTEGGNQEPSLIAMHRWAWNRKLSIVPFRQVVQNGISEERQFYKNVLYGPCLYSEDEFDWWSFPGIRDAIRRKDWNNVREQIELVAFILEDSARLFKDEGI